MERTMSLVALSLTAVRTRRVPSWSELQAVFNEWRQRARSRYELSMLDDHQLWDMGMTHTDADNEADKPFWQG
jgi:uncharacterized protein YjiS (DUF1127 family)